MAVSCLSCKHKLKSDFKITLTACTSTMFDSGSETLLQYACLSFNIGMLGLTTNLIGKAQCGDERTCTMHNSQRRKSDLEEEATSRMIFCSELVANTDGDFISLQTQRAQLLGFGCEAA